MRGALFVLFFVFFGILGTLYIIFFTDCIFAQNLSPDAIAIRVIPNPKHYSALRWYQEQGFSGSPQSLLVDGYRAIRDGRTVYVNVANIDDKGTATTSDDDLYTNIYLISYNQDAEQETVDIFSQILAHWKFNTNILNYGNCSKSTSMLCLNDSDCPTEEYCKSQKAKIIRDTKRLEDLADIQSFLDQYKQKNGHFPVLDSGSYLPHKTISVWPSWQGALAKELGVSLSIDPINRLGDCGDPRFNPITCWDEEAQEFADTDLSDPKLNLPNGSLVYGYEVSQDGSYYYLYVIPESNYLKIGTSSFTSIIWEGEIDNNSPQFTVVNLPTGHSGLPYEGYIEAVDLDGDDIKWQIDTSGTNWYKWSSPLKIEEEPAAEQIKIYADSAGVAGSYGFVIIIDDKKGKPNSIISKTFYIDIVNEPPTFSPVNGIFEASSTKPVYISFDAEDDYEENYPLFTKTTFGGALILPLNLSVSFNFISDSDILTKDYYTYILSGIINPSDPINYPIINSKIYNFNVEIGDYYEATSTGSFQITITNNPPQITNIVYQSEVRFSHNYGPSGYIDAVDPENNKIYFNFNNIPSNLSLVSDVTIQGVAETPPSGSCPFDKNYTINVTPYDEYGYEGTTQSFDIRFISYCGDGCKQTPNAEGRGGPSDDGVEECDGTDGLPSGPEETVGGVKQYKCTSGCSISATDCHNTCSYTGGYCGDGVIQDSEGEKCDYNMSYSDYVSYATAKGVTNIADKYTYEALRLTCEKNKCLFNIITATFPLCPDGVPVGGGCYIDDGNPSTLDCQKGKYVYSIVDGKCECVDVFSMVSGSPFYDECCRAIKEGNPITNAQTALAALGSNLVRVKPSAALNNSGNSYICDQICNSYDSNSFCVGIAITDNSSDYCKYVSCHTGNNCTASDNTVEYHCNTVFPVIEDPDSCTNPEIYHVGYSSCLCYTP